MSGFSFQLIRLCPTLLSLLVFGALALLTGNPYLTVLALPSVGTAEWMLRR